MVAADSSMRIKFFASLKEAFGGGEVTLAVGEALTVGQALEAMCTTPQKQRALFEDGRLRRDVIILVNGRNIAFLGGLSTPLRSGDVASAFPPIKGG